MAVQQNRIVEFLTDFDDFDINIMEGIMYKDGKDYKDIGSLEVQAQLPSVYGQMMMKYKALRILQVKEYEIQGTSTKIINEYKIHQKTVQEYLTRSENYNINKYTKDDIEEILGLSLLIISSLTANPVESELLAQIQKNERDYTSHTSSTYEEEICKKIGFSLDDFEINGKKILSVGSGLEAHQIKRCAIPLRKAKDYEAWWAVKVAQVLKCSDWYEFTSICEFTLKYFEYEEKYILEQKTTTVNQNNEVITITPYTVLAVDYTDPNPVRDDDIKNMILHDIVSDYNTISSKIKQFEAANQQFYRRFEYHSSAIYHYYKHRKDLSNLKNRPIAKVEDYFAKIITMYNDRQNNAMYSFERSTPPDGTLRKWTIKEKIKTNKKSLLLILKRTIDYGPLYLISLH